MADLPDSMFSVLRERYAELMRYCDNFVQQVSRLQPHAIHCQAGCSACCELSSVNALEAAVLWNAVAPLENLSEAARTQNGRCPLLRDDRCPVYPARPLICRTHGVAMRMIIDDEVTIHHCAQNYCHFSPEQLSSTPLLDEALITVNLSRLNIAFCQLIGASLLSAERFEISRIITRDLPESIIQAAAIMFRRA